MFTFYITTIVVYFNLLVSGMVVFQSADMPPIKLIDFKYRHRFSYVDSDQIILPNIVGGKEVSPKFYHSPWLAAIRKNDYQFCAGTLISKNILVTAAHCSVLNIPLEQLEVAVHRHDLSKSDQEEQGAVLRVKKINVHSEFNQFTLANDIAVWELETNEDLTNFPELDDGDHSLSGNMGTVTGWGSTAEWGMPSDVLMEIDLPIVDHKTCKSALGRRIKTSMLCAGGSRGKDACQGDSGGPMFVKNDDGKFVLVGVVSWGRGCARSGYPGVYTRISAFKSWIKQYTQ